MTELPVYLIHWNAPEWCAEAARSILASEDIAVKLTVIENGSDSPDRLVALLPQEVRLLSAGSNLGFAGGANLALTDWRITGEMEGHVVADSDLTIDSASVSGNGLRERTQRKSSSQNFVVICSHDIRLLPNTLSSLVDAMDRHPRYGIGGPIFWDTAFRTTFSFGGEITLGQTRHLSSLASQTDHADVVPVTWLHGALMIFRDRCAQSLGGFDEKLFCYGEDVEICLRARKEGWDVGIVPQSLAMETGHRLGSYGRVYLMTRNGLHVARRHLGRVSFLTAVMRALVKGIRSLGGSILPFRPRERRQVSRSIGVAQLTGCIAGIVGEVGPPTWNMNCSLFRGTA